MNLKNFKPPAKNGKPLKILFMVQLPPPVHGASLRNQSLVDSRLLQDSFDIRVQALSFANSVNDIGKLSASKIFKSLTYALRLAKNLWSFKPDLAYFTITPTGGAFYRDVFFVILLKVFSTRIIYHLRGIGIRSSATKNKLSAAIYNFVFRNAKVVCLSKSHLKDIQGLPYATHYVVHNGIKIEADQHWPAVRNEVFQFLFLSNFVKSKGIFELIEAVKKLSAKRTDFRVLMVGAEVDVTNSELIEHVQSLGLGNIIEISGPKYGEEKYKAIHHCDAMVFPTYYPFEVFPGVILEAMQCGKAVISTYHGVIVDIVDEGATGMLIQPKNIEQLAERMDYFLSNKDQIQLMGQNGREKFFREYTLRHFEENMKQMFNQAIA